MGVKNEIIRLLSEGAAYNHIAAQLGCSKSTVAYHAQKAGVAPGFKDHCWPEIQRFYDAGHSIRQCMREFGFSSCTWYAACRAGKIVARRDYLIPVETLMEEGRRTNRGHLKDRLLKADLLRQECYECGLTEWRGKPLSLELHHVNGRGNDNRLENLQLLCPNCHSQTANYAGRNAGKCAALTKILPDSSVGRTTVSGTVGPRFES